MSLGTTPSVGGITRRLRAIQRALYYSAGCLIGAASLAAAISTVGQFAPRPLWLGGAAAVAAFGLTRGGAESRRGRCWQVPKSWWTRLGDLAFVPAGFTLSVGFLTPIIFPTFWVLLFLFASLPLTSAVAVGVLYGAGRSVDNWYCAFGRPHLGLEDPSVPFVHRRLQAWSVVHLCLGLSISASVAAMVLGATL